MISVRAGPIGMRDSDNLCHIIGHYHKIMKKRTYFAPPISLKQCLTQVAVTYKTIKIYHNRFKRVHFNYMTKSKYTQITEYHIIVIKYKNEENAI